ncbi:TDP-4-keto-6-deoxy-glucose 3,4-isomerase, partial [Kitasatospora sp. NPDC036755]
MTAAPARLGERLQHEHGLLWLHRMKGDPYAALLCDVDEDPGPLRERVRAVGPLWRSATGPWVTGDPAMGAALLADPRL